MSVKIEIKDNKMTVYLSGRLDMETSVQVSEEIEKKLTDNITFVVFDMEKLQYLSSSGIRVLVTVAKEMYERDGQIDAINYSKSIEKILDITDFFSICK